MKNEEGERRERLLVYRGDASNSVGVLTRFTSSKAILVFLCDSVGVLSRPARSGATLDMKIKL